MWESTGGSTETIKMQQQHTLEVLADPVQQEILHDHYLDYLSRLAEDGSILTDREPIKRFIAAVETEIEKIVSENRLVSGENYEVMQLAIAIIVKNTPDVMTDFAAAYETIKMEQAAIVDEATADDASNQPTKTVVAQHIQSAIAAAIEEDKINCFDVLRRGSIARIQLLLDSGLDPNQKLYDGKTVLMHAVQTGREEVVAVLIAHLKRDLDTGSTSNMLDADHDSKGSLEVKSSSEGWTALLFAASQRNAAIVKLLLDAGANIHARGLENPGVAQAGTIDFSGPVTAFEMASADIADDRARIVDFDRKRQDTMDVFRRKYRELLVLAPATLSQDIFHSVFDGNRESIRDCLCEAVRGRVAMINASDMTTQEKMRGKQVLLEKLEDIFVAGKNPGLYNMLFQHVTKGFFSDFFSSFSKAPAHERDDESRATTTAIRQLILEVQISLRSSIKMALS